jgi:hypothetical protein
MSNTVMKSQMKSLGVVLLVLTTLLLASCTMEDPGPLQYGERNFDISGFDRLDMGSAFNIEVKQGSEFAVHTSGDMRNLDDLAVYKSGSTLLIHYNSSANRKHATNISITMPNLRSANFSGASKSAINGFNGPELFEMTLSGASVSKINSDFSAVQLEISGASNLVMQGSGEKILAYVSGASDLRTYDYPVDDVRLNVSGSSLARVTVNNKLEVNASGASTVLYRGNAAVYPVISGDSSVRQQ